MSVDDLAVIKPSNCPLAAQRNNAMMQAVQPFIDTSISKTVNVPADYPYDDFKDLYAKAWKARLKGLATYRPNAIVGSVLEAAPAEAPKQENAAPASPRHGHADDPMRTVIEKRPTGGLPAVAEKIDYWTSEGPQRLYLIVTFLPMPTADGKGTVERAIEFFMPVGQNGESQQWITATMRSLSLAARGVMHMSGATNGRLATQGWATLAKRTGTELIELSEEEAGKQITFRQTQDAPVGVITTPEWSGSEHGGRRYTAFCVNVEHDKPWHTVTGRMHYYLDHDWMIDMGESLPQYRPPLDFTALYGEKPVGHVGPSEEGAVEVAVRYITAHNKWAIHSQYYDNLHMLTLGRGGQQVWMSPADAAKIGVRDNDWVEAYNRNGIVAARANVSHRVPEGMVLMHHAQERTMNTPLTERSGRRGGTHNSLTRIVLKPSHFTGGYGQFTYAFNYIGPTGNNRDEVTLIRRRTNQEVTF